jgi:hypothetical protein
MFSICMPIELREVPKIKRTRPDEWTLLTAVKELRKVRKRPMPQNRRRVKRRRVERVAAEDEAESEDDADDDEQAPEDMNESRGSREERSAMDLEDY